MRVRAARLARVVLAAALTLGLGGDAGAGVADAGGAHAQSSPCGTTLRATRVLWVGPVDTDGDGIPDDLDPDKDGDGIPDWMEGWLDLDGDGIPNALDLDSDGDGIPDALEAVTTAAWTAAAEASRGPLAARLADGAKLVDTDGDGHPDAYDADADGDGIPDALEAGFGIFSTVDLDGDGIADEVDADPCSWGPVDGAIRAPASWFPWEGGAPGVAGDVAWRVPAAPDGSGIFDTGAWTGRPHDAASAPQERRVAAGHRPDLRERTNERLADGQEEDMGINPLNASSGCSTAGGPGGLGGVLLAALSLGVPRRRRRSALLALAGLVAVPSVAAAQDVVRPRLNIQTFDPNPQPATFTIGRDAEQAMRGTVSGHLVTNYGWRPLRFGDGVLDDRLDDTRDTLVDHLVGLDLGFNAAPFDWLELGLNFPVVQSAFYGGTAGEASAIGLGGSGDNVGIGDMTISIGVAPLQQRMGAPLNLSLIPRIILPTGDRDLFVGTGSIQAGGDLAIGRRWRNFRFSALGGYIWQDQSAQVADIYLDDRARWAAAVAVPFMDDTFEVSLEHQGSAVVTGAARDALGDDWRILRHTPVELLAGFLYKPNQLPLYVKAGLGPGLSWEAYGTPNVRAFLQVGARTLPRRPAAVVAAIVDSDGDGIPDEFDVCPFEPEDWDGFQDTDGCPDLDNDNDGIPDTADACPNRPEVFNDFEDDDGCPDQVAAAVVVEGDAIVLYDKVYFEYDRAQLRPVSKRVLDEVARTLRDNPEIQLVELAGHTDDRGPAWYNVELSRQRAMSVRNYLVSQGVDPARLRIGAYGEDHPVVGSARTEPEHALNRRVHLVVEMTDGGLELDAIRTVDADVPALPQGFDPGLPG